MKSRNRDLMDINTVLNGTQLYDNDGMYSYGMKKNLSPRKITIGRQDHKHEKFGRRKKEEYTKV